MNINPITFKEKPNNYAVIDKTVSRSAQPKKSDFVWLKSQGITDVINFRTMYFSDIDFNEQEVVENLGMKYHNISSVTRHPKEENVKAFLNIVEDVEKSGGKVHIHCKAGSDRTGMYSYIYKALKGLGDNCGNHLEAINMGHNYKLYPDLISWANRFVHNLKQGK